MLTLPTSSYNELGGVNLFGPVQRPVINDFKVLIVSDHKLSINVQTNLDGNEQFRKMPSAAVRFDFSAKKTNISNANNHLFLKRKTSKGLECDFPLQMCMKDK